MLLGISFLKPGSQQQTVFRCTQNWLTHGRTIRFVSERYAVAINVSAGYMVTCATTSKVQPLRSLFYYPPTGAVVMSAMTESNLLRIISIVNTLWVLKRFIMLTWDLVARCNPSASSGKNMSSLEDERLGVFARLGYK